MFSKISQALYLCKHFSSFLIIGKSNWEDDGWGAWEETETQEPVSLYKRMHACLKVSFSICNDGDIFQC